MSSKMEEILTIVSLHSVDVLDEEAALDSISHIISPKPKKAAKAIWDESVLTLKGGDGKTIVKMGRVGEHDLEPFVDMSCKQGSGIKASMEPVGLAKQDLYSGSILKPIEPVGFNGVCGKCYLHRSICNCSTAKRNIDPHFGVAFDPVTGIEVKKEVSVSSPVVKSLEVPSSEKIARDLWEQLNSLEIPKYNEDPDGYMEASRKEHEIRKKLVEATVDPELQELHKKAGWGAGYLPRKERGQKPSTLEVVHYENPEYKHLPEHAREMITMIEAEEFRIFSEFSESQADWHRIVKYKVDGSEEIQWLHKSEFDNTEAEEYEKFLSDSIAEVKNEKNEERVSIEGRDKVIVLKDMFNLHVSGVDS